MPERRDRLRRLVGAATAAAVAAAIAGCGAAVTGQAVRASDAVPASASTRPGAPSGPTSSGPTSPGPTSPGSTSPESSSSPGASSPAPSSPATDPSTTPRPSGPSSPSTPSAAAVVDDQLPDGAPDGVGATGIGDAYYPTAGNGGYDVQTYVLAITYTPASNALVGSATITARSTAAQPLRQFNLDLQRSMTISSVTVDGADAGVKQQGSEAIITPAAAVAPGKGFTVAVAYQGKPELISGGTAGLGDGGWYRTKTGGALVAGEPSSASAWYPVNEHPADAARYDITVTVPKSFSVISNGVRQPEPTAPAGKQATRWRLDEPIASYLVTLYIDTFDTATGRLPDGTPVVSALAPGAERYRELHELTITAVPTLAKLFGPYPYQAAGGIFTGEGLPFALETATRPVYADWVDPPTVIHELAHQWFGNHVRPRLWQDICLNECFASYAPWLYAEKVDGDDLDLLFKDQFASAATDPGFWSSPLVDMGAGHEFTAVYSRGPLALHVLRTTMGDANFFRLLTAWTERFGGRTATFDDLQALAEELSGKDLDRVFEVWFRGTRAPTKADVPASLR